MILQSKRTCAEQIEEMLDILKRRGYENFEKFIQVLHETQPHVAELLTDNTSEANGERPILDFNDSIFSNEQQCILLGTS